MPQVQKTQHVSGSPSEKDGGLGLFHKKSTTPATQEEGGANLGSMRDLEAALLQHKSLIETEIEDAFATHLSSQAPQKLYDAMHYSALGGKYLRSFLLLQVFEMLGGTSADQVYRALLKAGCAVELIHSYSLVHDDLPAMDDAALRRGKTATHKKFGEYTAILAGNALMALAYDILGGVPLEDAQLRRTITALNHAVGADGIMGGQFLDLESENQPANKAYTLADLQHIQVLKTGALFEFCFTIPTLIIPFNRPHFDRMKQLTQLFGQIFQVTDDMLDLQSTPAQAGKPVHNDARSKKLTTLSLLGGLDAAREHVQALIAQTVSLLKDYDGNAATARIQALTTNLMHRTC